MLVRCIVTYTSTAAHASLSLLIRTTRRTMVRRMVIKIVGDIR